jgi:hypothetical protein
MQKDGRRRRWTHRSTPPWGDPALPMRRDYLVTLVSAISEPATIRTA